MRAPTVILAALVAAGCGAEGVRLSKAQYEQQILEIRMRYEPEAGRLFFLLVSENAAPDLCVDAARRLPRQLDLLVEAIAELRPPEEIDTLQDEFVEASRETVDVIEELAEDVESGDVSCGGDYNRLAYGLPSTLRAEDAIERIEEKGYFLGFGE